MPRSRVRVRGVKELRRAILRAEPALREEALQEVINSTEAMYQDARDRLDSASSYAAFWHGQEGMQNITGQFRRLYRRSVSKKKLLGRVGFLSARSNARVFYAHFFLDGTVNQPARPIHDDAFEAEEPRYVAKQREALRRVLTKIFR